LGEHGGETLPRLGGIGTGDLEELGNTIRGKKEKGPNRSRLKLSPMRKDRVYMA